MSSTWLLEWVSPYMQKHDINLLLRVLPTNRLRIRRPTVYQQLPVLNAQAAVVSNTACLTNLPTELILEIANRLQLDAILALKLTQRRFNNILPLDQGRWQASRSRCTQRAIDVYLAPPSPGPSHRHCILCNATYPVSKFKSSNSAACVPMALFGIPHDCVKLPPRVCSWHVARFTRVIKTKAGDRNEWVSHGDRMCMHCGNIQGWDKCKCKCDSCSFWEITTFTRYLNNETECRSFVFWRESAIPHVRPDGRLWVREKCRDTTNHDSAIDLPVRPESA